jgi:ABC-type transport system involved in multi-copper enzyme maturation permease subunit
MNLLVRKEIRLLLPSFAAALLFSFSGLLFPQDPGVPNLRGLAAGVAWLFCPAMVVMMALDSFGRELASGTFTNLLAQPVPRLRVWRTKIVVLAGALAIVFSAWRLCFLVFQQNAARTITSQEGHQVTVAAGLFVLAVFSGGLWSVLLVRQVAAAFWMTLFVPGALALVTAHVAGKFGAPAEPWLIGILAAYAVAGFWGARRLFLGAQDVHWTGGAIAIPGISSLNAWGHERPRRPRAALIAKEFQLHQAQFVIAVVLALLHLGVIGLRKIGDGFKDSPVLEFFVDQFWVFWMVMPLLIGCAAVAEERKLATLETQLCLPAQRWVQFVIKFSIVLGLAVLFGVAAPLLLEGRRILPDLRADISLERLDQYSRMPQGTLVVAALESILFLNPVWPLLPQTLVAVGVAAIGFYASTLSRHTLQALSFAILGIWLGHLAVGTARDLPWRGALIYLIGVPALTLAIVWLAYWNFKRVLIGWPIWRRNGLVLLASLAAVIVLDSAIYNRVWELFSHNEPPHGTARLKSPQGVVFRNEYANLVVQLPDGRVWRDGFMPTVPSVGAMLSGDWKLTEIVPGGRFLDGTNWTSVAFYLDVVAVQGDGSLWVSEQPEKPLMFWQQRRASQGAPMKLVRFGERNDWKSVAGVRLPVFLLKTDGTLWRWGRARGAMRTNWPGLGAFQPVRLGTDSDWSELVCSDNQIWLRKADGRAWVAGGYFGGHTKLESLQFDQDTTFVRAPERDGREWRGIVWGNSPRGGRFEVGVRGDGTLRVRGKWRWSHSGKWEFIGTDVQLGAQSDWLAVAGTDEVVVTLKTDGSLWKWDFHDEPVTKPNTARMERLSSHSDWVAVCQNYDGIISLAADGSLWFWHCGRQRFVPSEFGVQPLLAPSRKPQLVGNIFASPSP